mmetsp:Transcript_11829/g.37547  ORF Transcript_11829/g.37547 Transcript_11829/m.37547 type:complete len:223 (+) Transcript_11829:239-907(+)
MGSSAKLKSCSAYRACFRVAKKAMIFARGLDSTSEYSVFIFSPIPTRTAACCSCDGIAPATVRSPVPSSLLPPCSASPSTGRGAVARSLDSTDKNSGRCRERRASDETSRDMVAEKRRDCRRVPLGDPSGRGPKCCRIASSCDRKPSSSKRSASSSTSISEAATCSDAPGVWSRCCRRRPGVATITRAARRPCVSAAMGFPPMTSMAETSWLHPTRARTSNS